MSILLVVICGDNAVKNLPYFESGGLAVKKVAERCLSFLRFVVVRK